MYGVVQICRSSFPSHTHPLILQPTPPTTRRSDGPLRRSHLSLRSTPNRHTHFLVLPLIRTHLCTRTPRTCLSTLPERGMMDIDACGRAEAALGGCRKYATSSTSGAGHVHVPLASAPWPGAAQVPGMARQRGSRPIDGSWLKGVGSLIGPRGRLRLYLLLRWVGMELER